MSTSKYPFPHLDDDAFLPRRTSPASEQPTTQDMYVYSQEEDDYVIEAMLSMMKLIKKRETAPTLTMLRDLFGARDKDDCRLNLKRKGRESNYFADIVLNAQRDKSEEKSEIKLREQFGSKAVADQHEKNFVIILSLMWGLEDDEEDDEETRYYLAWLANETKNTIRCTSSALISKIIYFCVAVIQKQMMPPTTVESDVYLGTDDVSSSSDLLDLREEEDDTAAGILPVYNKVSNHGPSETQGVLPSFDNESSNNSSQIHLESPELTSTDNMLCLIENLDLRKEKIKLETLVAHYGEIRFGKHNLQYIYENGKTLREILEGLGISDYFPIDSAEVKAIGTGVRQERKLQFMPKVKRPRHPYFCVMYFSDKDKQCVNQHIMYHLQRRRLPIPEGLKGIEVWKESAKFAEVAFSHQEVATTAPEREAKRLKVATL